MLGGLGWLRRGVGRTGELRLSQTNKAEGERAARRIPGVLGPDLQAEERLRFFSGLRLGLRVAICPRRGAAAVVRRTRVLLPVWARPVRPSNVPAPYLRARPRSCGHTAAVISSQRRLYHGAGTRSCDPHYDTTVSPKSSNTLTVPGRVPATPAYTSGPNYRTQLYRTRNAADGLTMMANGVFSNAVLEYLWARSSKHRMSSVQPHHVQDPLHPQPSGRV